MKDATFFKSLKYRLYQELVIVLVFDISSNSFCSFSF